MTPQAAGTPSGGATVGRSEETDVELLQAVAAGSERAFEQLRNRYGRAVERACRSIRPDDREDCAQEVFARIWRKAALFDPTRGSAAAWLLTLARRTALNFQPGRAASTRVLAADPDAVAPPDVERFWLDAALVRLPARERTVLELAYFDDLSEAVIAAKLHVPLGSVKSWKRRGLNRLATLLGEESP